MRVARMPFIVNTSQTDGRAGHLIAAQIGSRLSCRRRRSSSRSIQSLARCLANCGLQRTQKGTLAASLRLAHVRTGWRDEVAPWRTSPTCSIMSSWSARTALTRVRWRVAVGVTGGNHLQQDSDRPNRAIDGTGEAPKPERIHRERSGHRAAVSSQ